MKKKKLLKTSCFLALGAITLLSVSVPVNIYGRNLSLQSTPNKSIHTSDNSSNDEYDDEEEDDIEYADEYDEEEDKPSTTEKVFYLKSPTQAEIRAKYKELKIGRKAVTKYDKPYNAKQLYAEDYDANQPYEAGVLSKETLNQALDTLNFIRFTAGLPDDITLNDDMCKKAQHASLICSVHNFVTHTPSPASDMSDEMFQICSEGAKSCNLGMGYDDLPEALMYGYLPDTSKKLIQNLGHRRWLLNPSMKYTGFGLIQKNVSANVLMMRSYNAMYAIDRSREEIFDGDYICWPAKNMPYELYDLSSSSCSSKDYAFSVSLGRNIYYSAASPITVTVTSKKLGKTWKLDSSCKDYDHYLTVNLQGFGLPQCIIFNVGRFPEDDTVSVQISGLKYMENDADAQISYEVNFFNIYPKKQSIVKTTSNKNSFKVWWKKDDMATGYQIQYDTSKNMKHPKSITIKTGQQLNKTVKNLQRDTKYYVRVRTYTTSNNTNYYGKWSSTVMVP